MRQSVVVVWYPEIDERQKPLLYDNIKARLESLGISVKHMVFNPLEERIESLVRSTQLPCLVVKPSTDAPPWLETILDTLARRQTKVALLVDRDLDREEGGSSAAGPKRKRTRAAAKIVGFDPADRLLRPFCEGWFIYGGDAPYATRKVHVHRSERDPRTASTSLTRKRARLEPGEPQEIEIVRLIFELYACDKLHLSRIRNILIAENAPPPQRSKGWSIPMVKRILLDPVYMGANKYKDQVKLGTHAPIVEPWLFYAAQSRWLFEWERRGGSAAGEDGEDEDTTGGNNDAQG